MNCFICETAPKPNGTHYNVSTAIGICHHCGIGVCIAHGHKASEPGSPLLCISCESFQKTPLSQITQSSTGAKAQ